MAEPKTSLTKPGSNAGSRSGAGTRSGRQRSQKEQETDIEALVEELEKRVDRLRAAYDQYFMGIEKMPPHVQIKDVERRLVDLRKIQIRNTALRFKFQNTLQKYNTYQSYWARIVRQIEEGTYKRDVRRANERFGTGAKKGAAREIEIDVELDDLMSEDDLGGHLGDDPEEAPDTVRPAAPMEFDAPVIPASKPIDRRLFSLDPPDGGVDFVFPKAPIEERPSQKMLMRSEGKAALPPVSAPPPRPAGRGLLPPAAAPQPKPSAPHVPIELSLGSSKAPPRPTSGAPAAAAPPAQPSQQPPQGSRRKSSAPPPPRDAPQGRPQRKSSRPATNGDKPPAPAKPAAAPKPGELSEQRLRQLYSQYVETKRAQKESTAALSYDSLARSLRESSEKLTEKHGGKKVDFEVAVKDGKTILKPVLK